MARIVSKDSPDPDYEIYGKPRGLLRLTSVKDWGLFLVVYVL